MWVYSSSLQLMHSGTIRFGLKISTSLWPRHGSKPTQAMLRNKLEMFPLADSTAAYLSHQDIEQGRLPRSRRTDNCQYLPGFYGAAYTLEDVLHARFSTHKGGLDFRHVHAEVDVTELQMHLEVGFGAVFRETKKRTIFTTE